MIEGEEAATSLDLVRAIWDCGEQACERRGFTFVVELSDRSEAVYLHVRRETYWFGYRIANHEPFYPCSADYHQILVPRFGSRSDLEHYSNYFSQAIYAGGQVVADPAEVAAQIVRTRQSLVPGSTDTVARSWASHWEATVASAPPEIRDGQAIEQPGGRPPRLSSWTICRIRHRLNRIARWTYDERK